MFNQYCKTGKIKKPHQNQSMRPIATMHTMQLPLVSWVSCNKTTKIICTMYITTFATHINIWVDL